jgi:hypothetical protein
MSLVAFASLVPLRRRRMLNWTLRRHDEPLSVAPRFAPWGNSDGQTQKPRLNVDGLEAALGCLLRARGEAEGPTSVGGPWRCFLCDATARDMRLSCKSPARWTPGAIPTLDFLLYHIFGILPKKMLSRLMWRGRQGTPVLLRIGGHRLSAAGCACAAGPGFALAPRAASQRQIT